MGAITRERQPLDAYLTGDETNRLVLLLSAIAHRTRAPAGMTAEQALEWSARQAREAEAIIDGATKRTKTEAERGE